jgi:CRP/FNR family transcriptional regulator
MTNKSTEVTDNAGTRPDPELVAELNALGLSMGVLDAIAPALKLASLVHYAEGDKIYDSGDTIEALYVVRDGRIKLLNYLENGRARIIRLHSRGAIVGLNGLIEDCHTHSAEAANDVEAYRIPLQMIRSIRDDDAETYSHLLEYWHQYLDMADKWITDFSTGGIRGRVARLLQFLIDTDEATGSCSLTLIKVEEMADILGVTPESVSRTMAEMKRSGILESDEKSPEQYRCDVRRLASEAAR